MAIRNDAYVARRERFANLLGNGVAIIPTSAAVLRKGDTDHLFCPDSYFYYLTGFSEPEAILVIQGGKHPRDILFCRERSTGSDSWKDRNSEIWIGRRMGPAGAKSALGFDETYSVDSFENRVSEILRGADAIFLAGTKNGWNEPVEKCRAAKFPALERKDAKALLDPMRLVKDAAEIKTMRKAARISSAAHRMAMKKCWPGRNERMLEAVLNYEFRLRGGGPDPAYPSIVAGGNNACTLHYINNDCVLRDGDLVLIDAGCEVDWYASDVTRTFPVNGKFSPVQRALYEVVLESQLLAIAEIKPGVDFYAPRAAAWRRIVKGLLDLGIMHGEMDDILENWKHLRFALHSTSHFLGLDVHDTRDMIGTPENPRILEPGMVLTVEPGVYIPLDAEDVSPKWRGIGIRIEDDVLVTPTGHEVISSAPKTIEDIEATMR